HTDVDNIRVRLRDVLNDRPDPFSIGYVSGSGNIRARSRLVGGIYGVNIEIFVTALVLDKQNVLAVTRPEILADRTGGISGHWTSRTKGFVGSFDPNIHRVLIGFNERNVLTIGGDLCSGVLGVAENDLAVDQSRLLRKYRAGKGHQ